ncbi:MAG: DUF977 family protein [Nanoarchaeota archaeon]|nr:DUF977 family protein [Nanoarchaeota archaeon]
MNIHNKIRSIIPINILTNIPINRPMEIHNKILSLVRKEKVVTSSEVASFIGVSWNTAEKYLLELVIDGKIEKVKKIGVNLWLLK